MIQRNRKERILIVDDAPANLRLLKKMLTFEGFEHLTLLDDPVQTREAYLSDRPDLILLDLNMPTLNGIQVMAQLKALNDPLLPPIVILTAQHQKESLIEALEAGARDYITKPFDRGELVLRICNLLDAYLAHRMLHDQKSVLEEMVQARTEQLQLTRLQVVQRLGMAAEYRDEETGSHILRMSHTCALLAKAIGWNEADCDLILNASPMHDIGKIGIPDAVLLKPGKLDASEWEIMKSHASIGAKLLEGDESDLMLMARDIAASHHERWDGSGYPEGLTGEAIPEAGRIAALADVFDALTSVRPYKHAWPLEEALNLIREQSGKHFDPQIVDAFFKILPEILALRERFADGQQQSGAANPG